MKEKFKKIIEKDGFSIVFFILAAYYIILLIFGNTSLYTFSNIIAYILFAIFLSKNKLELLRFPAIILLLVNSYYSIINFMYVLENAQYFGMFTSACSTIYNILNIFAYLSFLNMLVYSTLEKYNDKKDFLTKGWYLSTFFWGIANFCNFIIEFNIRNFVFSMVVPIIFHFLLYKLIVGKRKHKEIDIKKIIVKSYKGFIALFIIAFVILFIWVIVEQNEFTMEEQISVQIKKDCKNQSTLFTNCKWSYLEDRCVCKYRFD